MSSSETPPRGRYLTAEIPGTGGRYRDAPEDFEVEETWPGSPGGSGEHVYLWIEKRGIPTLDAIRRLARALGAQERDAGHAGLKDARAVARQMLSFRLARDPGEKFSAAEGALGSGLRVLSWSRGPSKIRRGAHAGNRFRIRLRGAVPGAAERAGAVLEVLEKRGLPNAFGEQRFGARGHSAEAGRALVRGEMVRFVSVLLEGGFSGGPEREAEYESRLARGDHGGARALLPESRQMERLLLS
ncbi:MAG: tRNA pseudouridine(13) synthase TruD, partial [bacterium]|nr:tRNA pseudouridine(13) synthase TruD [bacterium]